MGEYFYNFLANGENQGYSYLYLSRERLFSTTRFKTNNELISNVFSLQLCNNTVIACKHGDAAWVDLGSKAADHFPDCAYPLLLPKARTHPYVYQQISADSGNWFAEATLTPSEDTIIESIRGTTSRRFTMQGDTPVTIDWGGAISHLCTSAEESIEGAQIDFII